MKYFVNESCIGCGLCTTTCPNVFTMTDENVARASDSDVSPEDEPAAEEALEGCPVDAIEHA